MSRTRFCIKEPLAASFAAAVGTGAPPSSDEPDPRPLLPLAQDPETPLRLMKQGPGRRSVRSVALDVAARAAAENTHVCAICPVAVTPPFFCDIHPFRQSTHREIYLLGQSAHRENKNLGISATFLRLRTLPCPRKAKKEPSHGKLPAFCASIRNWEARNNCQSQKSCNLGRFFVSGLLE